VDDIADSLTVTFAPAGVPEVSTSPLLLLGLAGLFIWCRHKGAPSVPGSDKNQRVPWTIARGLRIILGSR